jgi:NADH dehydrogenase
MSAEEATGERRRHIVILGSGFGGVYTAMALDRTLGGDPDIDITIVNRENFFLFTPMLHEVAGSDVDITHIVSPIRKMLRHVTFFDGDVESIDLTARRVVVSHGQLHHRHELEYDHLVVALGAITNFHGIPGVETRSLCMKSLGDAIMLRNRLIENLEEADSECTPELRAAMLTTVVAGGGFAGVETIGAVNDFLRESLECYPRVREEELKLVLVHPGAVILPELGPELGAYAQRKLCERGVEILVDTTIVAASDDGVTLGDGTVIPTSTLVWTAGTSPAPLIGTLPCKLERGRLVVDEYMAVPDWPGVWALGDCALIPDPKGGYYPPTAQHAMRQGMVLAGNIRSAIRGGVRKPFVFSTIGQLAAIGRRTGVARILGLNFSGFLAWVLWRTIYLAKLPRFEKKLRVALDWTLDVFFSKDLVQFSPTTGATMSHPDTDDAPPKP